MESGRAWRIRLDPEVYAIAFYCSVLKDNPHLGTTDTTVSNTLFEFIAAVVTIWQACLDGGVSEEASILCFTDNSSALGWMHHTSFGAAKPLHHRVAQKLIKLSISFNFALHPEHIPGKLYHVADNSSHNPEICDKKLTTAIHTRYSSQIPQNFGIFPLHPEIKCWMSSVVPLRHEFFTEGSKRVTSHMTGPGAGGATTSACLDSGTTLFLTVYKPSTTVQPLLPPSSNAYKTESGLEDNVATLFKQALSKRPLASWQRASGITTGQAPATSQTARGSTQF